MSEGNFVPPVSDSIDAEYMERWIGGVKINSLSPKTLFDIRCLLRHYRDIIVPFDDVEVNFPEEGNACASVDKKIIFIPTGCLEKGLVDDTIALVVHELNHIKYSESERTIVNVCSALLRKVMDSIFIKCGDGEYLSMKEYVVPKVDMKKIFDPSLDKNNEEVFFAECLRWVMLLLNAVEDIRIDAICSPNLRKYIIKNDVNNSKGFMKEYENGDLDENSLANIVFRMLYHHKGFIKDSVIDERFGDTNYIVTSTPREYTPKVLAEFQSEVRDFVESTWNEFNFANPPSSTSQEEDYISQLENTSSDEAFSKVLGDDKEFADKVCEGVDLEDMEVDGSNPGQKIPKAQTRKEQKEESRPIPGSIKASIDAFKDVTIYDCNEKFQNGEENYKVLVIN